MKRDLPQLAHGEFDILIIGGGAFGACAARDAALRGLRTALIERADFGGATSAQCFKMVHGGIRYLQHADIKRLRASCHERSALLRIAPHLVAPLPIAIPTYGHGRRGSAFLGAGARVYDLLTLGRNASIGDPQRQVRNTRVLGRAQTLELFPALDAPDLSGAVVFEDGQMHNPARLVLASALSAAASGATIANYIEALEYCWDGNTVTGAKVRDLLSGEEFEVRARLTLNAAGPWADFLNPADRFSTHRRKPFSRDACFIVDRKPTHDHALAVQGLSRDKDAKLGRSTRHLFLAPWHDKTLVGVWHKFFTENPDQARVAPDEIETWIGELNRVYPTLGLQRSEVTFAQCGLVPFGDTATESELSFGKESRLIDHRQGDAVKGLVTLIGIRFTTARADAARAIDLLLQQSETAPARPRTDHIPLIGGRIDDVARFTRHALDSWPKNVNRAAVEGVLRNHGSEHQALMRRVTRDPSAAAVVPGTTTLLAEVAHAVENEMALRLDDVVLRRTDVAAGAHPGSAAVLAVANEMARLLGWSAQRTADEVSRTEQRLRNHLARPSIVTSPASAAAGAMLAPQRSSSTATFTLHTDRA